MTHTPEQKEPFTNASSEWVLVPREKLAALAVNKHERMINNSHFVPNGLSCELCRAESDEGQPLEHRPTCLLAAAPALSTPKPAPGDAARIDDLAEALVVGNWHRLAHKDDRLSAVRAIIAQHTAPVLTEEERAMMKAARESADYTKWFVANGNASVGSKIDEDAGYIQRLLALIQRITGATP